MAISVNDPLFSAAAAQLDAENPEFLSDAVNLINRSPLLASEIQQLDATPDESGGRTVIQLQNNSQAGASSFFHSDAINISDLGTYDDSQTPYESGSLTQAGDPVTPASVFVGELGYELGHWFDPTLAPLYNAGQYGSYSVEQAVMTEFASEGTSGDDEARIKAQIDASLPGNPVPADMANGLGFFNTTSDTARNTDELRLLQTISDQAQAKSYLASEIWNVPVDGGTFLSTYWSSYQGAGSVNFLGIDQAAITNVTVQENAAGVLTGGTIATGTNTYVFSYDAVGKETAAVESPQGTVIYTDQFTDAGTGNGALYGLTRTESNASFTTDPHSTEAIVGNSNALADTAAGVTVVGNSDTVRVVAQGEAVGLQGNNNVVVSNADPSGSLNVHLSGSGNELILGGNATTVSGGGGGTTVFGGSGAITYAADGGTLVLSSAATVAGGAGQQAVFTDGGLDYTGGTGYADVIGSLGSDTISAGAGGGWIEGGAGGNNLLTGSNSGVGTVLDAGGNGDTLTGGTSGGDYFVAGSGNETLFGGNDVGTDDYFTGSEPGLKTLELSGNSVVNIGGGPAIIQSSGSSSVFGGTGQADLYSASSGTLNIYGFRPGTDRIGDASSGSSVSSAGLALHLTDGATIILHGVSQL